MRTRKPAKPKSVAFRYIEPESEIGKPMYALLQKLVNSHHEDLNQARIALCWQLTWKPDVDGRVKLGQCRKVGDLEREVKDVAGFDFVILLRRSFWQDLRVTDAQRTALLDHELCHARLRYDAKGEPVYDERGRLVYRLAGHDIEEFTAIVRRHGCYKADLESFAAALRLTAVQDFAACEECRETPGWVYVTNLLGQKAVTRCACFVKWAEQQKAVREEQAEGAVAAHG